MNIRPWLQENRSLIVLFLLFVVTMSLFLHRVPGLMGDEGSEGTNTFEILARDTLTIRGERSYIGVWIDYVRIPFIKLFGATTLAIRLPITLFSLATFWLAASTLRRLFGPAIGIFALVGFFFSPIFLTHQRFGWAVSLLPFCAALALFFFSSPSPLAPLLLGLALGFGLNTHLLFLPAAVAIGLPWIIHTFGRPHRFRSLLLAAISFWAMFGTQFVILQTYTEDQGEPAEVVSTANERVRDFPSLLPHILSGSSYIAHYMGRELSMTTQFVLTTLILVAAGTALIMYRRRIAVWSWALGLTILLGTLLLIIEYFSLRYFALWTMGVWTLAGIGIGAVVERFTRSRPRIAVWAPIAFAGALSFFFLFTVLLPFLKTGGSTETFSLGNRRDDASAIVDIRGLLSCIRDIGPVFSESIHIRNRIEYLAFTDSSLKLAKNAQHARWIIQYRKSDTASDQKERCPDLSHFVVKERASTDIEE